MLIKRDPEHNKIYIGLFKRRFIFEDGKYVGWYKYKA